MYLALMIRLRVAEITPNHLYTKTPSGNGLKVKDQMPIDFYLGIAKREGNGLWLHHPVGLNPTIPTRGVGLEYKATKISTGIFPHKPDGDVKEPEQWFYLNRNAYEDRS